MIHFILQLADCYVFYALLLNGPYFLKQGRVERDLEFIEAREIAEVDLWLGQIN